MTEKAGLHHTGWGYGVAINEYDNDGHDDLFLTYFGKNVLYHNGDGTFTDVTEKSGSWQRPPRAMAPDAHSSTTTAMGTWIYSFPITSTWIWPPLPHPAPIGAAYYKNVPVNCGPQGLRGDTCTLYHNNGDGTFSEVSQKAGILKPGARYGLTATTFDYNNDGWPDLFVACDSTPNLLFHNDQQQFSTSTPWNPALAVNGDGQEQANMGVAIGDYDGDGFLDMFLPHFSDDTPILYHNMKGEFFDDAACRGIGRKYASCAGGWLDFDNDGWLDIFHVAGTVYPEVEKVDPNYPYKAQRVIYRNLGSGTFEEVSDLSGPAVLEPHASRGCAFGDFDNDGNIDVLI